MTSTPLQTPSMAEPLINIRHPQEDDALYLVKFFQRNREHFLNSGAINLESDFLIERWEDFIDTATAELLNKTAVRFLVFHNDHGPVPIAKINYTQIFRGPFQACYLGYAMDHEFCGRGLMTRSLRLTIEHLFEEWNLHRIMANYLPENVASGRVLEKLGFAKEGIAKDYLRINGVWRDHVLTSLTNHEWSEPS